jgi:hypothetical protein
MDRRSFHIPASEVEAIEVSQLLTSLDSQPFYGNCTPPSTTNVPVNSPTTTRSSTTTTPSLKTTTRSPKTTTSSPTTSTSGPKTTAFSALPSCGQTCLTICRLNTQRWDVQVRIHTACIVIPTTGMGFAIAQTAPVEQLWRAP